MNSMPMRVHAQEEECIEALAQHLATSIAECVREKGECTLVLAGGSTPKALYERLADEEFGERIAWDKLHVFWGDERCVPLLDPTSNYRLAWDALLSRVPIDPLKLHPILGEMQPAQAAALYAEELVGVELDIVLLGMGDDGHTASLFPGGEELESEHAVLASKSPVPPTDRVSLSLKTINSARNVVFLVCGAHKAHRIQEVRAQLSLPSMDPTLPAARVRPACGPALWFGDRDALGKQ